MNKLKHGMAETLRQKNAEVGFEDRLAALARRVSGRSDSDTEMIGSKPNRACEGNWICYNERPQALGF